VRKAFAAGVVDGLLWGGYTDFMRRMGLPVYLEADKVTGAEAAEIAPSMTHWETRAHTPNHPPYSRCPSGA